MVTLSMSASTEVLASTTVTAATESARSTAFDAATSVGLYVFVEVSATFGAATLGGELRVYYSQDATWSGSEEMGWTDDIPLVASDSVQNSFSIPVKARYMKFSVYNNDAAVSMTSVSINAQMQTVA